MIVFHVHLDVANPLAEGFTFLKVGILRLIVILAAILWHLQVLNLLVVWLGLEKLIHIESYRLTPHERAALLLVDGTHGIDWLVRSLI